MCSLINVSLSLLEMANRGAVPPGRASKTPSSLNQHQSTQEEEEERGLINDLKRFGRLAVAWNRHGSPVPWAGRYPYSLSSAFHGVPPTPIEGKGPTMKRAHPQRGGATRAERGDHNFPSTGRRRVDRPIVALPSTTTPSWGGPSTRGPHGVCCPNTAKKNRESNPALYLGGRGP